MRTFTKLMGTFSLIATLTLAVAGCSSAPSEETYVPPGLELGDTVVNPPATLPPPMKQEKVTEDHSDDVTCEKPTAVSRGAIELLNEPYSMKEGASASLKGEKVVSAWEIPVESAYQIQFSHLSQVQLDSGKVVWFGSAGSLNESSVQSGIKLDDSGEASLFGATKDTYSSFAWGDKVGPDSAIVAEAEKVVAKYAHCFSTPSS